MGEVYIDPGVVRRKISRKGMQELWIEARRSPKVALHHTYEKNRKEYFSKTKLESKPLFNHFTGEANLKRNRPGEAKAKFGGTHCWVGACGGTDSWEHVLECPGYRFEVSVDDGSVDSLCKNLLAVHKERLRRWNAPLVDVHYGMA